MSGYPEKKAVALSEQEEIVTTRHSPMDEGELGPITGSSALIPAQDNFLLGHVCVLYL